MHYELERDHWLIPQNKHGQLTPDNVLPLCRSCNASKHDHNALEWLLMKFGEQGIGIAQAADVYFDWVRQQDS